ncbi:MAG: excinuclease ABC subunit UvrC [Propionibacteriaceae bacterium]|jgi:excinuclease ABC subunit C|nr:excinuclease ABC subunit UvrC [Propionibacteriaceae bacterium]
MSLPYRPKTAEIPTSPGVYRFSDPEGRVVYVGKAKNLRNRLTSYFQDEQALHPRTRAMLRAAAKVEWTIVQTELEALQLEWTWIKQYDPRFNVMFRDDKSYPWAAITWAEEFPRVFVGRGARRKGNRYYGPYQAAWAIRQTLDVLLGAYPMRSCSAGVFAAARRSGRPCLLGDIGKCVAPCVGRIDAAEHRKLAAKMGQFLSGHVGSAVREAQEQMDAAARAMEYEQAATWRDRLAAIKLASAKNAVVFLDGTDADVVALAVDELEVSAAIFFVRDGRIVGERGWIADRDGDSPAAELLQAFLLREYADATPGQDANPIPPLILVPQLPADATALAELLAGQRGAQVEIRVPKRGDKRTLLDTVAQNAADNLRVHKTRRASDLTTRSLALEEIQQALGLPQAPLRIECYDISHTQGQNAVASMVVFEDGLPRKSEYRRFVIRTVEGSNDVAAMREVLLRRFAHAEVIAAAEPQPQHSRDGDAGEDAVAIAAAEPQSQPARNRFAYAPALIVVDGGAPQVAAARAALAEAGVDVPLAGLAKRLEEVWLPGEEYPVILPRNSEGLYLLQRVRDEAHRFAIAHHRARRGKSMLESILEGVDGLGPAKTKALRRRFPSLKALRAATEADLAQVPGIGPKLAAELVAALRQDAVPAVNTATGEVG